MRLGKEPQDQLFEPNPGERQGVSPPSIPPTSFAPKSILSRRNNSYATFELVSRNANALGGLTPNGTQFDRNSYQPQCVSTRFSESKPDANAYRLIEEIEPGIIGKREILGRSSGS